jgi:hypothetical protein
MKIKVTSAVPPREPGTRRYPLNTMRPGESFFIAADPQSREGVRAARKRLLHCISSYRRRDPLTWQQAFRTGRETTKAGVTGIRVWRMK